MVDDAELRSMLQGLGIGADSVALVGLLPLVQVAWADGAVQPAERAQIYERARELPDLDAHALRVLESWLTFKPGAAFFARGHDVLRELAVRGRADRLDVVEACAAVASASGGLFGVIGAVSGEERSAIADIARALEREDSWAAVLEGGLDEDEDDPVTAAVAWDPPRLHGAPAEHPPPCLVVFGEAATVVPLADRVGIGRQADNEVHLPWDGSASRRHCRVLRDGERWVVVDCGSTLGTWVDGERVQERRLFGGEQLTIGCTEIAVHL